MSNPALEANMNPRFPDDPDTRKWLRIRSCAGLVALLTLAAGVSAISAYAPPPPEHVSVNCVEPLAPQVFSDAGQDLTGCLPAKPQGAPRSARPRAATANLPPPAADARADEPPIPTF